MKQDSKPLWQRLNEERTQGDFTVGETALTATTSLWVGGTLIAKMADVPHEGGNANAQYTALAVNNLESLAEALAGILNNTSSNDNDRIEVDIEFILKAKEALNKIS